MKKRFIFIVVALLSLFLCSCEDNSNDANDQNDFDANQNEIAEGKKIYQKLESEMKNFSDGMEQKNSIQINLNSYYFVMNSVVATQQLTMKANKSPMSILIEESGNPVVLFQENNTNVSSYYFDLDREGYYSKTINQDDMDSILDESGLDNDFVFDFKIDPAMAKIQYDKKYSIEVCIEDLLEINENINIDEIAKLLNASKDKFLKSILKYEVSIIDDKLDVNLSIKFKQWIDGKEVDASILINYIFILKNELHVFDLSRYHELPANSPEDVNEYTSIDSPISSPYKAYNDTYKIKLMPGIYTIETERDFNITFLYENMDRFPSYSIEYGIKEFLIIEEEIDLYMQVSQYFNEGYSLIFTKHSETVKEKQPLPSKINVDFAYKYDYVIYDTSSYNKEYMTLLNNTDKDFWFLYENTSNKIDKHGVMGFYFNSPYLIIVNTEETRVSADLNIYVPKNYGKVDITNGSDEYYIIGSNGFEAQFYFKAEQTGYFQIELIDVNDNKVYPNCSISGNGFTNIFHGYEGSTYQFQLSGIALDKPGLYKIRIKMIE